MSFCIESFVRFFKNERDGQAIVEGAFLIPVFLLVLLLLIQPSILLYDRMVMQGAAAEGCRLLVTGDFSQLSQESVKSSILHRLASIPQQENFHVHEGGCSYLIDFQGSESSEEVSVTIAQEIKLLPIFDFGANALGIVNDAGNLTLQVDASYSAKSSWVVNNEKGLNPESWVHSRD